MGVGEHENARGDFQFYLEKLAHLLVIEALTVEIAVVINKTLFNLDTQGHHIVLPIINYHVDEFLPIDSILRQILIVFLLRQNQYRRESSLIFCLTKESNKFGTRVLNALDFGIWEQNIPNGDLLLHTKINCKFVCQSTEKIMQFYLIVIVDIEIINECFFIKIKSCNFGGYFHLCKSKTFIFLQIIICNLLKFFWFKAINKLQGHMVHRITFAHEIREFKN